MEKVEARRMEEEKKTTEAKCKDGEQERDQLKKELDEFRAASKAHKKQLKEVWAMFVAEKETLIEDYQKQVDEMFFYGYECCMRKNGII